MVLAAGLGTRMRPLTDRTAKPLLPLGGQALLDHALDRLEAARVETVVVNVHWQADLVAGHLARRVGGPEIIVRRERTLLDTGGSVAAALDVLAPEGDPTPFYVVNGDTVWLDGPSPALERLAHAWDDASATADGGADAVLLVQRTFQVHAETGPGDFAVDKLGGLRRRTEREIVPYVYAGAQLAARSLFTDAPAPPFSLNAVWDRAIEGGRVRAVVHDGVWFHLSRPSDLSEAEHILHARPLGETR